MLRTAFARATAAPRFALAARNASTSAPATTPAPVSLGNIEASWKSLTPTEQEQTFKHLEELQKKDWKELSLDEKKAAYYVAFGPHGPREPIQADGGKTFVGVTAAVAVAGLIFYFVRKGGKETPATLTREWQEATDERLREQRSDPFTGASAKNGASQVTA
ncbi:hypothetical protein JCM3774_003746 [Rhodotorula dairenensis]